MTERKVYYFAEPALSQPDRATCSACFAVVEVAYSSLHTRWHEENSEQVW